MNASVEPTAIISDLPRADGSAVFSQNGYMVIGAINGPIEVQRRDELPEEAVIDVTVRPVAGVGGPRERHLESIIQSTLRQIILIHNFPRTLIQVILQITNSPEDKDTNSKLNQASSNLPILPALLQTSILALLSAAMPLKATLSSTLLAIKNSGLTNNITPNPTLREIAQANSLHFLAFTSHCDLLVAESEGNFSMDEWEEVYEKAQGICCGKEKIKDTDAMKDDGTDETNGSTSQFIRAVMQEKVVSDLSWRR